MKVLNRFFLNIFFLLLIVVVPALYSENVLDNALLPKFIGLSCVLFVFSFYLSLKSKEKITIDWVGISLIAFALFTLTSYFKAINQGEFIYEFLKIVLFVTSFFIAVYFFKRQEKIVLQLLPKLAVIATFIALVFSFSELSDAFKAREPFSSTVYLVEGLHGHKNLLSNWICLLIPFTLLGIRVSTAWPKLIFYIALTIQVGLVFLLQTRASLLGLMVFVLVIALEYINPSNAKRVLLKIFTGLSVIIGLILLLLLLSPVLENWLLDLEMESASAKERTILWAKSMSMIKANFFSGVGLGNWKIQFPDQGLEGLYRATLNNTIFVRPHNDFIWTLAESGIFAFLSFFTFIGLIVKASLGQTEGQNNANKQLTFTFIAGVCMFLSISSFDFLKERIEHSIIFAMLLAGLYAQSYQTLKFGVKLKFVSSRLLYSIMGVLALTTMYVGIVRFKSEVSLQKMLIEKNKGNHPKMKEYAIQAKNSFVQSDNNGVPIDWYIGLCEYNLGDISAAHFRFKSATQLHPFDFNVLNNFATTHFLQGQYKEAIPIYIKALKINPQFDEMRLNLASAYINIGDWSNAAECLKKVKSKTQRSENLSNLVRQNLNTH
ncbi:MAG: hypothetical protein CMO34_00565 [Verrucomicrobia bacterium]|nr:hypothetical protein [Verrucomicrobiota bacterium]